MENYWEIACPLSDHAVSMTFLVTNEEQYRYYNFLGG